MGKAVTVWLSATDDYENFEKGVKDADSFSAMVPSTNDVQWIEGCESLFVGTCVDEWKLGSNELDTPITPTNCSVKDMTKYGSNYVAPVWVSDSILFVDFIGRKVRELVGSKESKYAPDLTALSEHITYSGIVDAALQRNPDIILWCVLDDGSLVIMVYEREQNVVAWAKLPIAGEVQSVCVVPAETEDEIWISIFRTIKGATLYYEDVVLYYEGETLTDVIYGYYIEKFASRI